MDRDDEIAQEQDAADAQREELAESRPFEPELKPATIEQLLHEIMAKNEAGHQIVWRRLGTFEAACFIDFELRSKRDEQFKKALAELRFAVEHNPQGKVLENQLNALWNGLQNGRETNIVRYDAIMDRINTLDQSMRRVSEKLDELNAELGRFSGRIIQKLSLLETRPTGALPGWGDRGGGYIPPGAGGGNGQ